MDDRPDTPSVFVAGAEDTVLRKLEWFRPGGDVSDRQWNDILGVLVVGAGRLDRGYLTGWAARLGLSDLLEKAIREASARSDRTKAERGSDRVEGGKE